LREEGTPPKDDFLKHAREHACRKITRAGAKLAAEFEAVAKECLKSGDLDRAEAVLSEKADLLAEMKAWKQIKTQGSPENQSAGNTPAPQVEGRQGVWLHDLQEKAVDGRRLDGVIRAAFPQDMVWFRKGAVRFGGEDIPFSIFLHPPTDGLSRVTFDVPLGVERLAGAVAVGDASEGRQATALTFKVLDQNDMPIWTSKLIFGKGKTEAFDVPLRGTKAISLVVMCPGDWAWAHAVWLGPKFFP
jgi:hypothetical protein